MKLGELEGDLSPLVKRVVALILVAAYPRNPRVYPLAVLSIFHGVEHVYIFNEF